MRAPHCGFWPYVYYEGSRDRAGDSYFRRRDRHSALECSGSPRPPLIWLQTLSALEAVGLLFPWNDDIRGASQLSHFLRDWADTR